MAVVTVLILTVDVPNGDQGSAVNVMPDSFEAKVICGKSRQD